MELSSTTLSAEAAYKLLVGVVVPRPIAWVTTLSSGGSVNLAPFSFFTVVSQKPPMIAISVGRRKGELKDTARNIDARRDFVVNICDETMFEKVHLSGADFPENVSEAETLGLALLPSRDVAVPRLADSPINLECTLSQTIEFGDLHVRLIVGEVRRFHIRDDLYRDGKIDTERLRPLARVAGPSYASLDRFIHLRPT